VGDHTSGRRADPPLRILDGMNGKAPLGEFLATRRALLQPQDVGLAVYDRRRVPGLRRDEVALLAGVSISYYIRLEQGNSLNASAQVLDALAKALLLNDEERAHLHRLSEGGAVRGRARKQPPERVSDSTRQLLAAVGDAPAVVLGRRSDVLAWNRTGHALFAGHLDPSSPDRPADRPNTARLVFLDAHTRELYEDWPQKARDAVGKLRLAVGRYPDDSRLAELIGELTVRSPEFSTMWSQHKVRDWDLADYSMRHPVVGSLTVTQHSLQIPRTDATRMVVVTAEPGSPSEAALRLLAQITVPHAAERHRIHVTGADVRA